MGSKCNLFVILWFVIHAFCKFGSEGDIHLEAAIHVLNTHGSVLFAGDVIENARMSLPEAIRTVLTDIREHARNCSEHDIYRRADGVGNNLEHTMWGASLHSQLRILPNAYMDGKGVPRVKSESGKYLPSARTVSLKCFPPNEEYKPFLDRDISQMFMQFAQYLDHDLVLTELEDGSNCCANLKNGFHPDTFKDGPCFPIPIEPNDRYFTSNCMPFRRSYAVYEKGARQQLNAMTSYLDASQVYGPSSCQMCFLRQFKGGLLKVAPGNMLPEIGLFKCVKHQISKCPHAGDSRVSVFPGLSTMHTLFHREHNRVAQALAKVNPHWDDEKLFQEARKISIAIHQKIIYKDYLPMLLGPEVMRIMGLDQKYVYDPKVNPGLLNAFGAAAYRYGHSQINGLLRINKKITYNISQTYFQPECGMYKGEGLFKSLVCNQARCLAQKVDQHFTTEVTDLLFLGVDAPGLSFDLAARNIQRGRDHGLPPYLEYVDYCLTRLKGIKSLPSLNLPTCLKDSIYESVRDVDLFVGGMYETHLEGALLGPTFACIIAEQFYRLKVGDRFFYQTQDKDLGFTEGQLEEIEKTNLSTIICLNSQARKIQPNALASRRGLNNKAKPCSSYQDINFEQWRDDSNSTTSSEDKNATSSNEGSLGQH